MKKVKMLLSSAMMLMFSVSVFAGQCQEKKCMDWMIFPQDEQCCNEKEVLFTCDENMLKEECPMFNHGMKRDCMNHFKGICANFKKDCCEKMFKDLNLTDKQKEDLKALKESAIKKQQELMKTIINEKKTISEELLKEKYSEKIIKKSVKNIKNASNKMTDNKIAEKQALKKILTNEQYVKMFKIKTRYDILAEKLNLSKEQQEKVENIFKANIEKKMELCKQCKEKRDLLKQEMDKLDFNKDVAISLNNDINEIRKSMFNLKIEKQEQLKSVLSEEQYNKMREMCHKKMPMPQDIDNK